MSLLFKVLNWFVGGKNPIEALTETYIKYKDSTIESERIKADVAKKQIDLELDSQQAARQIRLATAGFWEQRLITFLIVFPFIVHLWMVFLDTLGQYAWSVDAFPSPFNNWEGAILLSYFGLYAVEKAVRAAVTRKT